MADPSKAASDRTQRLVLTGLFAAFGSVELGLGTAWLVAGFLFVAFVNLGLALLSSRDH